MTFLWCREDTPLARCTYEGTGRGIQFISYEVLNPQEDVWWQMIPIPKDNATLYEAMARRVVPEFRFTPAMSEEYGTRVYNPEVMCRTTHGACPQDPCWMRYEDDPSWLCYKHVDVQ